MTDLEPGSDERRSAVCPSCGRVVAMSAGRCPGCGHLRPGLWGFLPLLNAFGQRLRFTPIVLWGCGALFVATLLYEPDAITKAFEQIRRGQILTLFSPGREPLFLFGMSGGIPVFRYGRWWTILSAAWLHGGLLHIFFNLMWIRHLAPAVAQRFGVGRLVVLYTVSSITGFLLTSVMALLPLPGPVSGAYFTVGASAPLFGLFGALVLWGQKTGNRQLSKDFSQYVVIWVIIGVAASMGSQNAIRIDNWAHLGGFAGGYLTALWLASARVRHSQHYLTALLCLLLTALSIVVSIVHGLQFVE